MARKQKGINLDFFNPAQPDVLSSRPILPTMFKVTREEVEQAQRIEINRLKDNPYQPRLSIEDRGVQELAQVIRSQGFQGVLVARPHPQQEGLYQLTAGHRRREASKLAGLTDLPVLVKDLSDEEMAGLAITENIQREDLTPLEEGKIFLLMTEEMGYTHEQIAREIGKNRGYVENRLRVARAPEDIQMLVRAKPDSLRAVSTLIKVRDTARRAEIIDQLLNNQLTADDLPGYISYRLQHQPEDSRHQQQGTSSELAGARLNPEDNGVYRQQTQTDPSAQAEGGTRNSSSTTTLTEGDTVSSHSATSSAAGNTGPVKKAVRKGENKVSDERALRRVGSSKLATALRTLRTYQGNLQARQSISEAEFATLSELTTLAQELINTYNPALKEAVPGT